MALCALVILGSGYLLMKMNNKKNSQTEQAPSTQKENYTLTDLGESDLLSLTVENRFGEYTLLKNKEGLAIEGRPEVKLNQQAAKSIVYSLGNIKSNEKIEASTENLARYGLEHPAGKITLKTKNTGKTVVDIGNQNPSKSGFYAIKEGDPAVYLLNSYLGSSSLNSLDLLRDRTLPPINLKKLTRLTIKGDRTIDIVPYFPYEVFSSTLSPYLMVKPYRRPVAVNTETYSKNLEALSKNYSISRFIHPSEADKAGVNEDSPEITMQDKEGKEVTIKVGNTSEKGDVYCRVSTIAGIVTLPSDAVKLIHVTPLEMADKFVRLIGIDNIGEVKLETPEESWIGTVKWLDSKKDKGEFTFQGASTDEEPFKKMYQEILYLLFEGEIPGEFSPSGTPDFKITFTGNSDSPGQTSAEFFDYNQDYYAISIDGYSPEFLIGKYQIEALITYLRNFKGE